MTYRLDEKGKFYTSVVPKNGVEVLIECLNCRIQGIVFAREDERLKDALNVGEQFLAVTEARVFAHDGSQQYSSKFLAVNRENIVWIIPLQEMLVDQSQPENQP